MCGIAGFNWQDKSLVEKMTNCISHRGPDGEGTFTSNDVSFGHRRLSIIDLSEKASQPMLSKDKSIALTFNGEIWNFRDLRNRLESLGYKFKSNSDTEVILIGYQEFGEKICQMLEGMFAFAIWDRRKKKILLCRDRIGKKPLYYFHQNGKLIFSSEIKSILSTGLVDKEIDLDCLSDYLSLRYSSDSLTIFKKIKKLPPGHYAVLDKSGFSMNSYWHLPTLSAEKSPGINEIDSIIKESVRKRLMSDVPIGVFLSGGLDSSAIVAYMHALGVKIRTFSVGFGDVTDETKFARIVAEKFGTEHTEIKLNKDILNYLPEVVYSLDEPLADPAALPTYLLCREVSKKVKVALSGEGGDEVFGGYHTYNYIDKLRKIDSLPSPLKSPLSGLSKLGASLFNYPKKQMFNLASEIFADSSLENNFKKMFYFPFSEQDREDILHFKRKDPIDRYLAPSHNLEEASMKYYFEEWLPNDLLMKVDKLSMAHGLEVRVPYLDQDLIKYFFSIDNKFKKNRMIFRKVVSKYLPKEIMGKKKQGFTLPLSNWFTDKKIIGSIRPHLEDLKKRKVFNEEYIDDLLAHPERFRNDHKLWVLLNFEIWSKIYLDGKNPKDVKII